MKIVTHRPQRTIARPADVHGIGYLTGKDVRLRFLPAPASSGILFVRADLKPPVPIAAQVQYVTGTHRRTTLGDGPLGIGLVEHVLAALAGLRIDNCLVELSAPEPPGLDGSSQAFVDALVDAGITVLSEQQPVWSATEPITIAQGDATLTLHPSTGQEFRATYFLDYGAFSPIPTQSFTDDITPETFLNQIACARTFLLEGEAHALRQQGLGRRTQVTDLVIFGPHGPINNRLRFANEPARHKILDLLGDLSLCGHALAGHIVACRSGHPLNILLARELHDRIQAASTLRRAA